MVQGNKTSPLKAQNKFILASSSPRRKMLLEQIGFIPDKIINPDIDESPLPFEKPEIMVQRLAFQKAQMGLQMEKGVILAADTIVTLGSRVLGKTENESEALSYLSLLSGRKHNVITAVALISPQGKTFQKKVKTSVSFKRLTYMNIETYIQSNEWVGKAGGYAIQGLASRFIKKINGSYTNVVGLPLFEVANLLEAMNITPKKGATNE